MTTALMTALLLITAEASSETPGEPPIDSCAENPGGGSDPRPPVRRHMAERRRLTALSMILANYEEHGKKIPPELPEMLRQAQEDFLDGRGGEFRTRRLKRGDTLSALGKQLKLSAALLKRINHIRNDRAIPAGREIKVVDGPFKAVVDLSERRLRVFLEEALVREYEVAVGADKSPTPEGEFQVTQKVRNPQYDKGDEHYKPLDPRNPAGTRWIRLKGAIGIHGTNDSESIPGAVSDGCIRLRNEEVEELFDFLVIGSPVVIKP